MTKEELQKKIAFLEFVNDQITAEVRDLDNLLTKIGFPNGIESAKEVVEEMIIRKQKAV